MSVTVGLFVIVYVFASVCACASALSVRIFSSALCAHTVVCDYILGVPLVHVGPGCPDGSYPSQGPGLTQNPPGVSGRVPRYPGTRLAPCPRG